MASLDISRFIGALRSVLPPGQERYALHEPEFGEHERALLIDCLDSGYVSSVGRYVTEFERALEEYTGAGHAIAVVNGTAALHIALKLAGAGPGDEVLMPALTFVATPNAARYCGATPHFVDCEPITLGLDAEALAARLDEIAVHTPRGPCNRQTGARLAAIVPMHAFGHPANLQDLVELAARWGIPLVEDAAESLGSRYKGRHTGCFGQLAALSFNGNKIVTTGGGGAILTRDAALAARARHLTTTARVGAGWRFVHDETGYNYRMPNLNAALGVAQLARMPRFLEEKRRLADRYAHAIAAVPGIRFVAEPADTQSNYWLCTAQLDDDSLALRDAVLEATNAEGIMTRPAWSLMHALPMYANCPRGPLPVSERLERQLINLPSSAALARQA